MKSAQSKANRAMECSIVKQFCDASEFHKHYYTDKSSEGQTIKFYSSYVALLFMVL